MTEKIRGMLGMQSVVVETEVGGIPVLVEAVVGPGFQRTGSSKPVEKLQGMFTRAEAVIEQLALTAVQIGERVAAQSARPDEIEVQFGLKFSATGDIVIASAGAEASLGVRVVYRDRTLGKESDGADAT
ncbi:CU044_2847 family protein [Kribbella deserti]|uniref:CU044_2847 family protein n=1 Tax=Kribbella deserti TaxID=1926257 RepID=A0ABV6QF53_9ACTN